MTPLQFQKKLLQWFDLYGRKTLPWQKRINPYRVWLSEIMLQQTQVTTVIDYFLRFTKAYPTLKSLSMAKEDDVLALWTGLGYYARARNLLKCAKIVATEHHGRFPSTVEALEQLPGIGRSTAGAIRSIAFRKPATILDGNVKRVLCRVFGIKDWAGNPKTHEKLWEIATELTPKKNTADYTQAIMDLGAMICSRSKPSCYACPFQKQCYAYSHDLTREIPAKKPKTHKPTKTTTLVILQNKTGEVYLEKRPAPGIWGGLWCFPEVNKDTNIQDFCHDKWQCKTKPPEKWPQFKHTFTHYHLLITPVIIEASTKTLKIHEKSKQLWYNLSANSPNVGLPAPIKKLLKQLKETE